MVKSSFRPDILPENGIRHIQPFECVKGADTENIGAAAIDQGYLSMGGVNALQSDIVVDHKQPP